MPRRGTAWVGAVAEELEDWRCQRKLHHDPGFHQGGVRLHNVVGLFFNKPQVARIGSATVQSSVSNL